MTQTINEPVSVSLSFDARKKKVVPRWIIWNGKLYPVIKVGLHHTYRRGHTLHHVFSIVSNTMFFRLNLNSDNLHWTLEEVGDELLS